MQAFVVASGFMIDRGRDMPVIAKLLRCRSEPVSRIRDKIPWKESHCGSLCASYGFRPFFQGHLSFNPRTPLGHIEKSVLVTFLYSIDDWLSLLSLNDLLAYVKKYGSCLLKVDFGGMSLRVSNGGITKSKSHFLISLRIIAALAFCGFDTQHGCNPGKSRS